MEPNQDFEHAILKRVYTKDDMLPKPYIEGEIPYVVLHLQSTDTENLLPGTYYYTVKLARHVGGVDDEYLVDTLVTNKKFILID